VRCEVLAVGTELLLGDVIDTNGAWIGQRLAEAGIDCLQQVKVGDNQARIETAIRAALARSDAVICCGGLGPTQDDITREAIAGVLGVSLERDPDVAAWIERWITSRGRAMARNNLRQADVPRGATIIHQVQGSAPGLICRLGDRTIYAVPGVPVEMREMVGRAVIPDLIAQAGGPATIVSRVLRTWGVAESTLDEMLTDRMAALDEASRHGPAPTIAFLASGIEGIKVRISAKASSEAEARALIAAEEAEVRQVLGSAIFAVDDDNMEAAIGHLLTDRGLTMGVAESLTGGYVGGRLTAVPGASAWFRGGIVAYDAEVKRKLLGVGDGPVVSESAAQEMAAGAAAALGADVGLALTGVAGPTEQDGQPVGTVWVGYAFAADVLGAGAPAGVEARLLHQTGDRNRIREFATINALNLLRLRLLGEDPPG
jgi:nicotinamide-nucleotide amidase